jgi:hypothetical protein
MTPGVLAASTQAPEWALRLDFRQVVVTMPTLTRRWHSAGFPAGSACACQRFGIGGRKIHGSVRVTCDSVLKLLPLALRMLTMSPGLRVVPDQWSQDRGEDHEAGRGAGDEGVHESSR